MKNRRRFTEISLVFLASFALFVSPACNSQSKSAQQPITSLAGQSWTCITLDGAAVTAMRPPTITFDGAGRVNGFSGVNRFGGSVESAEAGELHFGQMMSTKMAGPPEQMALESSFLSAITRADRYMVIDTELIFSAGKTMLVQFKSEPLAVGSK
jgi:heat shock protein HslJ